MLDTGIVIIYVKAPHIYKDVSHYIPVTASKQISLAPSPIVTGIRSSLVRLDT